MLKKAFSGLALILLLSVGSTQHANAQTHPIVSTSEGMISPSYIDSILSPDSYYHFIVGYQAELHGDLVTAAQNYRQVINADRKTIYVRVQLAGVLLKLEEFEEAERILREVLMLEPESVESMAMLAQVLNARKKPIEAISFYERILEIEPENDNIRLHLTVLLASTASFDRAEEVIEEVEDAEVMASGFYYIGVLSLSLEQEKVAEKAFKKSININPQMDASYQHLGRLAKKRKDYKKAESYFKKAMDIDPTNMGTLESMSELYLDIEQPERAIEIERMLMAVDPGNIDSLKKIGLIYMSIDKFEEAANEFTRVLELDPSDMEFRYYLAVSLDELKKYREALVQHEILHMSDPENTKVLLNIGYLYSILGENEKSAKAYEKLIILTQEVPDYYIYLARNYLTLNKKDDTLRVLSEGINRFDEYAEMHFTMSLYHEQSGHFDLMVAHLRRTIELDPNHAEALNFLGYSFAEKGMNLEEALHLVNRSLDLKPGNGYITDSLGWVYYKLGMHKKAVKVLEKAYSIVRDDPVILEHLGDAYYAANNEKKALKIWRLALEAKDTSEIKGMNIKERLENKIKNLTKNTIN